MVALNNGTDGTAHVRQVNSAVQFRQRQHTAIIYTVTRGCCHQPTNWRAPWKNRISPTTMKLRKSLVKPVTWQKISSYLVLPPEIVMHDTSNVILWTSADICIVVHGDLGWKNRTTQYILPRHWLYEWFSFATNVCRYMRRAWRSWVKEPNHTRCNRFWRAGCSRLEYVEIRLVQ